MRHLSTSGEMCRGVIVRYVTLKGEKAKAVADGRKLKYTEWKELGISLGEEWEHISTHMFHYSLNIIA